MVKLRSKEIIGAIIEVTLIGNIKVAGKVTQNFDELVLCPQLVVAPTEVYEVTAEDIIEDYSIDSQNEIHFDIDKVLYWKYITVKEIYERGLSEAIITEDLVMKQKTNKYEREGFLCKATSS